MADWRGDAVEERSELLARLTRVVATTQPDAPLAARLCIALARILDFDGGATTVGYIAPDRITLCATDEFAERLEDLQDVLREGPGLDAHRLQQPVMAAPHELPSQWPILARSMAEQLAPAHLLALPMRPDSEVLGVLTLYRQSPLAAAPDLDEAQFLANAIGVAILGAFDRADATDEVWTTRDCVNQATGMVVAQLRISPADALAVLRAHAYAHDTTLAAIATAVVTRELDFRVNDGDQHGPGNDG